jgi:hypothetical protein
VQTLKVSNEERKAQKLAGRIRRAHNWRVQVWAQSELRIRRLTAELAELGNNPPELFEPEFSSDKKLEGYTTLLQDG